MKRPVKARVGRPQLPVVEARAFLVLARFTRIERGAIDCASADAEQPRGDWARSVLLEAARKSERKYMRDHYGLPLPCDALPPPGTDWPRCMSVHGHVESGSPRHFTVIPYVGDRWWTG